MPVLLGAEHVARAADLEVAHGDLEPGTELRELHDGLEAFGGVLRHHPLRLVGKIGMREAVAPPHPAAQLIELGDAEPVGIDDDERVGVGQVDAVFDDGGGDENVVFAAVEPKDVGFQRGFVHAPVRDADARFGDDLLHAPRSARRGRSRARRRRG